MAEEIIFLKIDCIRHKLLYIMLVILIIALNLDLDVTC